MSECDEVADAMPLLPWYYTLDDTRRQVRITMRGESEQVIDNVAWAWWERGRDVRAYMAQTGHVPPP